MSGPWADWDDPTTIMVDAVQYRTLGAALKEAAIYGDEGEFKVRAKGTRKRDVRLCDEHEGGCEQDDPCLVLRSVWVIPTDHMDDRP